MRKLLLDFLILSTIAFGLLWLLDPADAQTWDWSPRARHHTATCEVRSGNPEQAVGNKQEYRGGSGVYVSFGELRGVLTAAHVMLGNQAKVRFSDGVEIMAEYTVDKFGHDVAFIFATHPSITPVPMSQRNPSIGERVELVTYGGPEKARLRSFWATIGSIGSKVTRYNCDVLSGDSGGGILNLNRELVGIETLGYEKIETQKEWHAYRGAGSANTKIIRDFLRRVSGCNPKSKCGPGGCSPKEIPPSLNPFYPPPRPVPAAPPSSEAPEIPSTPLPVDINYDLLATAILKQINPDDFRGPAGSAGPQGPAGLAVRGPTGANGEPGPAGLRGPSGSYSDLTEDEKMEIAEAIKELINGSVRVKVQAVPQK